MSRYNQKTQDNLKVFHGGNLRKRLTSTQPNSIEADKCFTGFS